MIFSSCGNSVTGPDRSNRHFTLFSLTFSDEQFMTRVAALHDIYDVLGRGSMDIQNVQHLPWESQTDYNTTVDALHRMASALAAMSRKAVTVAEVIEVADFEEDWPNLSQHRADIASQVMC